MYIFDSDLKQAGHCYRVIEHQWIYECFQNKTSLHETESTNTINVHTVNIVYAYKTDPYFRHVIGGDCYLDQSHVYDLNPGPLLVLSKHETLSRCWAIAGPPSTTLV